MGGGSTGSCAGATPETPMFCPGVCCAPPVEVPPVEGAPPVGEPAPVCVVLPGGVEAPGSFVEEGVWPGGCGGSGPCVLGVVCCCCCCGTVCGCVLCCCSLVGLTFEPGAFGGVCVGEGCGCCCC